MTKLSLFLFGMPRMERDGVPIQVDTRKAIALMSYLAVTGQHHSREHLARFLWGESDLSHARAALRRTLSVLNKALSGNWLQIALEKIGLNLNEDLWVDVREFARWIEDCHTHGHAFDEVCPECQRCLQRAFQLYQADFLAGFQLSDSPAFDDWQFSRSEALHRQLDEVLEKLSRYHFHREEFELAITYAQRWCDLDPLQEAAHCRLMKLYAATYQLTAVQRQYQKCVDVLNRQLGIMPQAETTELYHQLSQSASRRTIDRAQKPSTDLPVSSPTKPLSPLPSRQQRHNLPPQLAPCIGREETLQEIISRLYDPFCRLLTISGPGGVGKTRLALEVAYRLLETADFHYSIYFISLTSVHSAEFLISALIQALNIPLSGREDPKRQLLHYLHPKQALLVLDNFEHLLPAAPLILEILQATAEVKLLVTSRECLNFHAEWLFELEGLTYPARKPHGTGPGEPLHQYSAIQLFLYNAARIQPKLRPNETDLSAISRICHFVSGFPLGIELASTLLRQLSSQRIADELEHNLDLLTTTMPDIPERHRSLRTVFEFSWRLLPSLEQECFKRLSIFRGSFSYEAAQQITNASPALLATLSDKSLLRNVSARRYEMHELIKQFAQEKLQTDTAVFQETQARHACYFARLLHEHELHFKGARQKRAIETIGWEIEEIRAAWDWSVEYQSDREINCLLEGLYTFYEINSWFREGEEKFRRAATQWEDIFQGLSRYQEETLQKLRSRQASFIHRLSRYEEAQRLLENSLAVFRRLHVSSEILFCLHQLGIAAYFSGNYAQAQTFLSEGLTIAQTIEDEWNLAHALNSLGNVFLALGQYPAAKQHFHQSLVIRRSLGDQRGIAVSLNNLGRVAEILGEDTEAEKLFRESITIKQRLGDRRGAALSSLNLGYIFVRLGNLLTAEQLLQGSLMVFREIGEAIGMISSLTNLGNIAFAAGQYAKATELYEESLSISTETGDKRGIMLSLNDLGNVAQALGNYEASRVHFSQALTLAIETQAAPLAAEALIGLAAYRVEQKQMQQALEIVSFVRQQSTNDRETLNKADELYHQLVSLFSQDVVARTLTNTQYQTLVQISQIALN